MADSGMEPRIFYSETTTLFLMQAAGQVSSNTVDTEEKSCQFQLSS